MGLYENLLEEAKERGVGYDPRQFERKGVRYDRSDPLQSFLVNCFHNPPATWAGSVAYAAVRNRCPNLYGRLFWERVDREWARVDAEHAGKEKGATEAAPE